MEFDDDYLLLGYYTNEILLGFALLLGISLIIEEIVKTYNEYKKTREEDKCQPNETPSGVEIINNEPSNCSNFF
jgi:hypothetical protein